MDIKKEALERVSGALKVGMTSGILMSVFMYTGLTAIMDIYNSRLITLIFSFVFLSIPFLFLFPKNGKILENFVSDMFNYQKPITEMEIYETKTLINIPLFIHGLILGAAVLLFSADREFYEPTILFFVYIAVMLLQFNKEIDKEKEKISFSKKKK